MSEWNVIQENFHTKHSVLTAPDEHMPYIIQLQTEIDRQTDRDRDRQTKTETERQRQRDRQRATDRQRQRATDRQRDRDRQTETESDRQTETERQTYSYWKRSVGQDKQRETKATWEWQKAKTKTLLRFHSAPGPPGTTRLFSKSLSLPAPVLQNIYLTHNEWQIWPSNPQLDKRESNIGWYYEINKKWLVNIEAVAWISGEGSCSLVVHNKRQAAGVKQGGWIIKDRSPKEVTTKHRAKSETYNKTECNKSEGKRILLCVCDRSLTQLGERKAYE